MAFTEFHMQIAAARYFNPRKNIIVPNVSWGLHLHECDLLVLTSSGFAYEVECKVSRSDLLKDSEKSHGHRNKKLSQLWFIVPAIFTDLALKVIPDRAGLLTVAKSTWLWPTKVRDAKREGNYQFTVEQRLTLGRLGCMRIWNLMDALRQQEEEFILD